VPVESVRPHVPSRLEIDTKDGVAWVSAVAFHMRRVRPRGLPPLSPISNFLELNLRTYVRLDEKPGVFFLSIYANKRLAVKVAKWFSPLPYAYARMNCLRDEGGYRFQCVSVDPAEEIVFSAHYKPESEVSAACEDSLSEWLLERYCLYVGDENGGLIGTEIHHEPWAIQEVVLEISSNTLGRPFGLDLALRTDRANFSSGVSALAWPFGPVQKNPSGLK
jgi:uncharacterized protein YqjF (DUF2071 family)